MFTTPAFANTPILGASSQYASLIPQVIMLLTFGTTFYFLIWKPQNKRSEERQLLLTSLKVGDTVYTTGGIVGKITMLKERFLKIEVAPNIQLVFQKDSVVALIPKNSLKEID